MREEKAPVHSRAVEFKVWASQTVLNFKDKRACCLSNSRLRAERERQQKNLMWALWSLKIGICCRVAALGNDFQDSQEVSAAHCISEKDKGFLGCLGGLETQRGSPGKVKEEAPFVPSPPAGQRALWEKVNAQLWFEKAVWIGVRKLPRACAPM